MEREEVKHYIVYQGQREFYHAMLVSEEGYVIQEWCCSHPGFMFHDLYDRHEKIKAKIPLENVDQTPYQIEIFKEKFRNIFDKTFTENEPSSIEIPL